MSEKTIENIHVVIYGKKMLKEAVKRLSNEGKAVEDSIFDDFINHDNDMLIFNDGVFKVVQILPNSPNYEVSLNDLMEIVISDEKPKELEVGKWYWWNLDNERKTLFCFNGSYGQHTQYGFSADGKWSNQLSCIYGCNFSKATPEQVGQGLINEVAKRGYEFDNYIYDHRTNILWGNNLDDDGKEEKALFSNGNWAAIIAQPIDKFADSKVAYSTESYKFRDLEKPQVGDVCKFWDDNEDDYVIGKLVAIDSRNEFKYDSPIMSHKNACSLSKQEVYNMFFGQNRP